MTTLHIHSDLDQVDTMADEKRGASWLEEGTHSAAAGPDASHSSGGRPGCLCPPHGLQASYKSSHWTHAWVRRATVGAGDRSPSWGQTVGRRPEPQARQLPGWEDQTHGSDQRLEELVLGLSWGDSEVTSGLRHTAGLLNAPEIKGLPCHTVLAADWGKQGNREPPIAWWELTETSSQRACSLSRDKWGGADTLLSSGRNCEVSKEGSCCVILLCGGQGQVRGPRTHCHFPQCPHTGWGGGGHQVLSVQPTLVVPLPNDLGPGIGSRFRSLPPHPPM